MISTLFYISCAAPSIKLVNTENAMQVNAEIECTATCNSLLTWRLHTHNFIDDRNGRNWYEVVAINRSGNLCTEKIALISQWFAPSVNAVSVQCIAVYVCPTESCLHGICSSNIQGTYWVGMWYKYQIDDTHKVLYFIAHYWIVVFDLHTDVFISKLGNTVTFTNVEDSKGATQYNFYVCYCSLHVFDLHSYICVHKRTW